MAKKVHLKTAYKMVAQLAAAAASRLGPTVRSVGGKLMHAQSGNARRIGSKLLRTSDKKIQTGIETTAKNTQLALKVFGTINKNVGKIMGTLAKSSPALKQQLVIMNKGLMLMLRPIGDIMAKFIRPMSIWVMKVAQKWYSMFGTGGGNSEAAKEDALENATKQLESLKAGGAAPEEIAAAQARVDKLSSDTGEKAKTPLGTLFKDILPQGLQEALGSIGKAFSALWEVMKEVGKLVWDIIGPGMKRLAAVVGGALAVVLTGVIFLFEGVAVVLKFLAEGLKTVRELGKLAIAWLEVFGDWIGKKLTEAWDKLKTKLSDAYKLVSEKLTLAWENLTTAVKTLAEWITNTFIGVWDGIKKALGGIFDWVKEKVEWLKNLNPFKGKDDAEGKAVGGDISQTGMYKLHAGERVLTAGENSQTSNTSQSNIFNTTVNLQATINSELDIEEIAKKLAALNETELRRRVSYF